MEFRFWHKLNNPVQPKRSIIHRIPRKQAKQPNPSNEVTRLNIGLEKPASVSITISNLLGQTVERIATANMAKGEHNFVLNTSSMPSGIYLVNIVSGSDSETVKLVVKH
jgi:hypothetical protein